MGVGGDEPQLPAEEAGTGEELHLLGTGVDGEDPQLALTDDEAGGGVDPHPGDDWAAG